MTPLISVIVPVYNKEKYIQSCIKSVIAQTYQNVEILLVNDGSTDVSGAICEEFANNHPNVLLIHQENQGVSAARNNGMAHANGDYLIFLDADDTLPNDAIEAMVDAAKKHNADLTIGKMALDEDIPIGIFIGEDYLKKALEDNPITYSACRILYKREFVQDLRFPVGYIAHEDSFFVFLCALKKPKVVTINKVVYNYTDVNDSASNSSFTSQKYDDICNLLAEKERYIVSEYRHLHPLYYHLKTKIQMVLLQNLSLTKGKDFRKKERDTLKRFKEAKEYYQADLPCSNVTFYNLLSNNMYYFSKITHIIRNLIQRVKR